MQLAMNKGRGRQRRRTPGLRNDNSFPRNEYTHAWPRCQRTRTAPALKHLNAIQWHSVMLGAAEYASDRRRKGKET